MDFEYQKAVQAVNFFARARSRKQISKLHALKLIFFADRYHLRKYGSSITNDEYWAMTYGPVASCVKDIIEFKDEDQREKKYADKFIKKINNDHIASINEIDNSVLSSTELEALQAAEKVWAKHPDIVKFSHKFPEWKKHEDSIKHITSRSKMNLEDFFDKASSGIEYCGIPEDIVTLNREFFLERQSLLSVMR